MIKYEPDHVLVGSEVIESKGFIVRKFLTNSRGNLDCYLRFPDKEKFSKEQLEAEDREFEEFLDEIFS